MRSNNNYATPHHTTRTTYLEQSITHLRPRLRPSLELFLLPMPLPAVLLLRQPPLEVVLPVDRNNLLFNFPSLSTILFSINVCSTATAAAGVLLPRTAVSSEVSVAGDALSDAGAGSEDAASCCCTAAAANTNVFDVAGLGCCCRRLGGGGGGAGRRPGIGELLKKKTQ